MKSYISPEAGAEELQRIIKDGPRIREMGIVEAVKLYPDSDPAGAVMKLAIMAYDLIQRGLFVLPPSVKKDAS